MIRWCCHCAWSGLRKTMLRAHRQAWAWQDEYHGLTLADIRQLELQTQQALRAKMAAASSNAPASQRDDNQLNSFVRDENRQSNVSIATLTSANTDDNTAAAAEQTESSHVTRANTQQHLEPSSLSASPASDARISLSLLGAKKRDSWNSIRSSNKGTCTWFSAPAGCFS